MFSNDVPLISEWIKRIRINKKKNEKIKKNSNNAFFFYFYKISAW